LRLQLKNFSCKDIATWSRYIPPLGKVAANIPDYHTEDLHRAGASLTILAELDRTELIDTFLPTVHSQSLEDVSDPLHIMRNISDAVKAFFKAGSAAIPIQTAFSHSERCYALDADREKTVFAD
jgi:dihydroxy-acid dehydratase